MTDHDLGIGQQGDKMFYIALTVEDRGFPRNRVLMCSLTIVDLEKFVPGSDIDPVYFDSPYYVYPDGAIAAATAAGIITVLYLAREVSVPQSRRFESFAVAI